MAAPRAEIVQSYRQLHRALLSAVQRSTPARRVARDQLRAAFRERGAAWDGEGAKRTLWFLQAAARERGLEHRVLKNLLQVRRLRDRDSRTFRQLVVTSEKPKPPPDYTAMAWKHYNMTVAMLNKTMGIHLR